MILPHMLRAAGRAGMNKIAVEGKLREDGRFSWVNDGIHKRSYAMTLRERVNFQ